MRVRRPGLGSTPGAVTHQVAWAGPLQFPPVQSGADNGGTVAVGSTRGVSPSRHSTTVGPGGLCRWGPPPGALLTGASRFAFLIILKLPAQPVLWGPAW